MKVIEVPYNTQIDNPVEHYGRGGILTVGGSGQCGYNMAAHVLYPLTRENSDAWIDWYAKQIESEAPGTLGSEIRKEIPWYWNGQPDRRAGAAINSHAIACRLIGRKTDPGLGVVLRSEDGSVEDICDAIDSGSPVGMFTLLTPSGHFIALIGYDQRDEPEKTIFTVHDSYGNFSPHWDPASLGHGGSVSYSAGFLRRVSASRNGLGYYYYWKR